MNTVITAVVFLIFGGGLGFIIGYCFFKDALEDYRRQYENLLKAKQAPYEVVARTPQYENVINQEVKRDDNAWW